MLSPLRTGLALFLLAGCSGVVMDPRCSESLSSATLGAEATSTACSDVADMRSLDGGGGAFSTGVGAITSDANSGDFPGDATDATSSASGATTGTDADQSMGSTGAGTTGSDDAGLGEPVVIDPCGDGAEPLAAYLRIRDISLYQAVKIPLVRDGTWQATRSAPVVQNKRALVRVFVEPLSGFISHVVRALLTLDNGGVRKVLASDLNPVGASTEAVLGTTFNFEVQAVDLGPSTKLSVALTETHCPTAFGAAPEARFPAVGLQDLAATQINKLRVVVVPIVLGGRTPETSAAALGGLHDNLLAHYPVPEVEMTVRSAVSTGLDLLANGAGWSDILNLIMQTRQQDQPASDVYYYGLVTPRASFEDYCCADFACGCVAGIGAQPQAVWPDAQVAVGLGYRDAKTVDTVVHELGHAHGRGHAPCAPSGSPGNVDPGFPYGSGGIGSWGWDSRSGTLQDPAVAKDVMGYCNPTWISDYTYNALALRSQTVNTAFLLYAPEEVTWQGLLSYAEGNARWTGTSTIGAPPGEGEHAQALDARGRVVEDIQAIRLRLSHSSDSILYLPAPKPTWSAIAFEDRTILLDDVAAAF